MHIVRKIESFIDSLFNRGRKKSRYRLHDTWEPDFESELTLAVSSFQSDGAFHRVFGEGRVLNEKSVTWHFIGWVMRRRYIPTRHSVTVRKDKHLKALIAGTLYCVPARADELIRAFKKGQISHKIKTN